MLCATSGNCCHDTFQHQGGLIRIIRFTASSDQEPVSLATQGNNVIPGHRQSNSELLFGLYDIQTNRRLSSRPMVAVITVPERHCCSAQQSSSHRTPSVECCLHCNSLAIRSRSDTSMYCTSWARRQSHIEAGRSASETNIPRSM